MGESHPAFHAIFLLWVVHTKGYLVTKNGLENHENSIGKREKKNQILDLWISGFYTRKTVKTTTGTYRIPKEMPQGHATIFHEGANISKLPPDDEGPMVEHGQYLSHFSRWKLWLHLSPRSHKHHLSIRASLEGQPRKPHQQCTFFTKSNALKW